LGATAHEISVGFLKFLIYYFVGGKTTHLASLMGNKVRWRNGELFTDFEYFA